ncbi:MAG: PAS domain-containing protein, partial [Bacteroidales bacterium]|nr:PAS domain-containing protein [Bacteroidales bacterium]
METFKDKSKDELIQIIKSFQKEQEKSKSLKFFKEKIADDFENYTQLNTMFMNHGSIILFIEPESGKIVYANKTAEKFYGYDSEQLMKMMIDDINCLTKNELKQKRSDAKTKKQNVFIFKHKINGGDIKTVEVHSCPVTCCGNELLFLIIHDITEEQKHIENIKLLNKRFLSVEKIGSFGFFEWDLITNDIFLSHEIYKIYGIPDNVLNAGEFINKVVHPDDLEFVNKNLESAVKGIKKYHIDHRIIRPDGTIVWLNNIAEIEKDEKGKPIKLIGTVRDITEKKKLETELQKSEQKYRILAENTYDWEYWTDPDGNYKYLSPSCERITGYSHEEFIKNPDLMFDIVHPDFREKVHKHYHNENNKNTPVYSDSFPITTKTGKLRWIQHRCFPVFDKDGNFMGRRGNNRDISDLKLTEFKLKEQNEEYSALNEEYK